MIELLEIANIMLISVNSCFLVFLLVNLERLPQKIRTSLQKSIAGSTPRTPRDQNAAATEWEQMFNDIINLLGGPEAVGRLAAQFIGNRLLTNGNAESNGENPFKLT